MLHSHINGKFFKENILKSNILSANFVGFREYNQDENVMRNVNNNALDDQDVVMAVADNNTDTDNFVQDEFEQENIRDDDFGENVINDENILVNELFLIMV